VINSNGMLMVEPSAKVSAEPLIDSLTRKMCRAWRVRRIGPNRYKGVHFCSCGANSDNGQHFVTDGSGQERETNSLAIHYLAFHRPDLLEEELAKVRSLPDSEVEPTAQELAAPRKK
jgi:hypothetical protein